jgi:hypothetical protein
LPVGIDCLFLAIFFQLVKNHNFSKLFDFKLLMWSWLCQLVVCIKCMEIALIYTCKSCPWFLFRYWKPVKLTTKISGQMIAVVTPSLLTRLCTVLFDVVHKLCTFCTILHLYSKCESRYIWQCIFIPFLNTKEGFYLINTFFE